MNGIDYRVRYTPRSGKPYWGYYLHEELNKARLDAKDAVSGDFPMIERVDPVLKAEVFAGSEGSAYFDTLVETYWRTAPIIRPDLECERFTCAQMRY